MSSPNWQRIDDAGLLVLGHRGTRSCPPENTFTSFDAAMEDGASGIEFDVRLDRDGRAVVFHDRCLTRITANADTRPIEALSSTELDRIRLAGAHAIPKLDEVLDWARTRGAILNVELKADTSRPATLASKVLDSLRSIPTGAPILVSSFDPCVLVRLRDLEPALPLGWLAESGNYHDGRELAFARVGACTVCAQASLLTAQRASVWRSLGATLVAWTVNDPSELRRVFDVGCHAIISDFPRVARDTLD